MSEKLQKKTEEVFHAVDDLKVYIMLILVFRYSS